VTIDRESDETTRHPSIGDGDLAKFRGWVEGGSNGGSEGGRGKWYNVDATGTQQCLDFETMDTPSGGSGERDQPRCAAFARVREICL
jgi:hypothetical protein